MFSSLIRLLCKYTAEYDDCEREISERVRLLSKGGIYPPNVHSINSYVRKPESIKKPHTVEV